MTIAALLILLQAAPEQIDLTRLPGAPSRCERGAAAEGEVVVCGRQDEPYRLKPLPAQPQAGPPLTVVLPGGGTANLHAEQHTVISGQSAPAAMVTVKLPF